MERDARGGRDSQSLGQGWLCAAFEQGLDQAGLIPTGICKHLYSLKAVKILTNISIVFPIENKQQIRSCKGIASCSSLFPTWWSHLLHHRHLKLLEGIPSSQLVSCTQYLKLQEHASWTCPSSLKTYYPIKTFLCSQSQIECNASVTAKRKNKPALNLQADFLHLSTEIWYNIL